MENTTTNNLYPKRYMSIKELVPYGFTEHQLKQFLNIEGISVFRGPGKTSKWHIDTTKLDSWLMRRFGTKGDS